VGTKASANGVTNEIVIGYNAIGKGSNTISIGNSSITDLYTPGNLQLSSGKVIKINSVQVVTARQTAIADVSTADATDLTSAVALANANKAKINTILAMIRTHGLIAT
jgi:hypothetical protein